MSLSLVADYESSSSGSENENDSASERKEEPTVQLASASEILNENNSSIASSVFSNPYREAENYEQSILERHVKMTSIKKSDDNKPNKICFKYSKGKCKLGDKCHFLHSNPQISYSEPNHSDPEDQAVIESKPKSVKKRCGLKDDLVPPKKFMKTYKNK